MRKPPVLCFSLVIFGFSSAQPTLTGRISDWNNNPVPYAQAVLKTAGRQTTTDLAGFFDFSQAAPATNPEGRPGAAVQLPRISGNHLTFSIMDLQTPVSLSIFSCDGRSVVSRKDQVFPPGDHSIPLLPVRGVRRDLGLFIAQIRIGAETHVLRFYAGNADRNRSISASGGMRSPGLARKSAGVDSLIIQKFGYLTKRVAVESYDGDAGNISLEYALRTANDPPGMKPVPGGIFQMGSVNGRGNETPVHTVVLSAFLIDSTEVSQADYARVVGKEPWIDYPGLERKGIAPNLPAWYVNWYDAVHYCNSRSKREGRDTVYSYAGFSGVLGSGATLHNIQIHYSRNGFRLPTEAEWEYACRSGTRTEYYWGTLSDSATVSQYCWFALNSGDVLHSVAVKKSNALGLYDMPGNNLEWCNDFYSSYYPQTTQVDPMGPEAGDIRILRGASMFNLAREMRSAFRGVGDYPHKRYDESGVCGFRTVLPVM